ALQTTGRLRYPLAKGEREQLRTRLVKVAAEDIRYTLGDAGRLEYYLEDTFIGNVPLKAVPPDPAEEQDSAAAAGRDLNDREEEAGRKLGMLDAWRLTLLSLFGGRGS